MNDKRSYLDSLNAGRPRRPQSSLEELNRTLEALEGQFQSGRQHSRQPGTGEARPGGGKESALPSIRPHEERPLETLARGIEHARMQEEGLAAVGKIAAELKDLREELRHKMTAASRRDLDALRQDLERLSAAAAAGSDAAELRLQLERLSEAIRSLADRADEDGADMLRAEIGQVKDALDLLLQEEPTPGSGQRWEGIERRKTSDPALEALNAKLEQISDAVNNLPDTLALRSLEGKFHTLASAVEQLSRLPEGPAAEAFETLGERLDEISRAIVASPLQAPVTNFDPQPFDRIEARITSLARQIEELADDRPVRAVVDVLAQLSERVDEASRRADLPSEAVAKLSQQVEAIAKRQHDGPAADAERLLQGFETRFAGLSAMLEQRQNETSQHGQTLVRDVERRLADLAKRLHRHKEDPAPDQALVNVVEARFAALSSQLDAVGGSQAVRNLETRLEDISTRLDQSAKNAGGIDPELIRNLEAQVAGLAEHLSRPGNPLPGFEDVGPRLDHLEQSMAQSREFILSAARQAAEEAIRGFSGSTSDEAAVSGLAGDLKSLEMLARRSDERNTRTYEAIHDTLLKIVEHLGSLESGYEPRQGHAQAAPGDEVLEAKLALDHAPSMESDGFGLSLDDDEKLEPSRSEAAAALAAISNETGRQTRKRSMFGGLTRALSSRRQPAEPVALAGSPGSDGNLALTHEIDLDEPLDPKIANRPLEPGSGAPDLSAIMKRVRDERAQPPGSEGSEAAKSDFIAAARRAAQAAAAEAEILKKQADKKNTGSGRLSMGDLLRARRKPLLIAAGAILMALSGLQLGKAFMASQEQVEADEAAVVDQPVAETAALEEEGAVEPEADVAQEKPAEQTQGSGPELPAAAASPAAPVEQREAMAAPPAKPESRLETAAASPLETAAVAAPALEGARQDVPVEVGPVALREAAAGGDAKAMFEIGSRYAEGRGTGENLAEAAKWYQKSADLGFAPAQYRLGSFYEKGLGVDRDPAKAKTWYRLAAAQGNAKAMHNLAVLFAMGADGRPDNDSAARWFVEAAELGVTDSQFNLGILTARGVGTAQNLEESYKWFALVAKTGDKDAGVKRDEIANALSSKQLERARAATELWRAKPVDPQSNTVDIPASWKDGKETTAGIDVKQAVKDIQLILTKKGYDAGGADGVLGQKTRLAIAAFQKENDMAPTGEVNEELVQALLQKR